MSAAIEIITDRILVWKSYPMTTTNTTIIRHHRLADITNHRRRQHIPIDHHAPVVAVARRMVEERQVVGVVLLGRVEETKKTVGKMTMKMVGKKIEPPGIKVEDDRWITMRMRMAIYNTVVMATKGGGYGDATIANDTA